VRGEGKRWGGREVKPEGRWGRKRRDIIIKMCTERTFSFFPPSLCAPVVSTCLNSTLATGSWTPTHSQVIHVHTKEFNATCTHLLREQQPLKTFSGLWR